MAAAAKQDGALIPEPKEPARLGLFRTFAFGNPAWDWRRFNWDRDIADVDRRFAYLNATSPNLQDFKARGGRIVITRVSPTQSCRRQT